MLLLGAPKQTGWTRGQLCLPGFGAQSSTIFCCYLSFCHAGASPAVPGFGDTTVTMMVVSEVGNGNATSGFSCEWL